MIHHITQFLFIIFKGRECSGLTKMGRQLRCANTGSDVVDAAASQGRVKSERRLDLHAYLLREFTTDENRLTATVNTWNNMLFLAHRRSAAKRFGVVTVRAALIGDVANRMVSVFRRETGVDMSHEE